MVDVNYWNNFYSKGEAPTEGSTFAKFVMGQLDKSSLLFELGCGNGRDSLFFAQQGISQVVGCDLSDNVIMDLNEKWKKSSNLRFINADFTKLSSPFTRSSPITGDFLGESEELIGTVYSRFTFHAIRKEDASRTIAWTFRNMKEGGKFFIEVRSVLDPMCGKGTKVEGEEDAWINTHYRRFIRKDQLIQELEHNEFEIETVVESNGLAVWKDDDPVLIRVVAIKPKLTG
eukprot:TRINITY_DN10665_c0_g1_i1.p1 TRINITY_DN10665_c0_g1~~TRINITY_DN10665_c0_g1_i1.p1  ORF type:complete len:230 (+),score=62.27 TRINITY_DN10665_c0_g1_i1:217-906(+)